MFTSSFWSRFLARRTESKFNAMMQPSCNQGGGRASRSPSPPPACNDPIRHMAYNDGSGRGPTPYVADKQWTYVCQSNSIRILISIHSSAAFLR
ncbi:hypothetical protein KSP40_PGU001835 [Platanthera guangdongensis]|uniref:Uncharacterized protein n=1 Tax=Platanthera guangdongensis TaxID=2320717 RepID=A0ABR2M985_9ASPA